MTEMHRDARSGIREWKCWALANTALRRKSQLPHNRTNHSISRRNFLKMPSPNDKVRSLRQNATRLCPLSNRQLFANERMEKKNRQNTRFYQTFLPNLPSLARGCSPHKQVGHKLAKATPFSRRVHRFTCNSTSTKKNTLTERVFHVLQGLRQQGLILLLLRVFPNVSK